jgi:hypothetical protein
MPDGELVYSSICLVVYVCRFCMQSLGRLVYKITLLDIKQSNYMHGMENMRFVKCSFVFITVRT